MRVLGLQNNANEVKNSTMTQFEANKKKLDFRPCAAQLTHSLDFASGVEET